VSALKASDTSPPAIRRLSAVIALSSGVVEYAMAA
jgi:hypothetical protein